LERITVKIKEKRDKKGKEKKKESPELHCHMPPPMKALTEPLSMPPTMAVF
jgi:hypothetical protein